MPKTLRDIKMATLWKLCTIMMQSEPLPSPTMCQNWAIHQRLGSHCEHGGSTEDLGTNGTVAQCCDLAQTLKKLNCILNLIVGFTFSIFLEAHTLSEAQRSSTDWMVYPAGLHPPDPQASWLVCLLIRSGSLITRVVWGIKSHRGNLGVTLQHGGKKCSVSSWMYLCRFTPTHTWHNLQSQGYMGISFQLLLYQEPESMNQQAISLSGGGCNEFGI